MNGALQDCPEEDSRGCGSHVGRGKSRMLGPRKRAGVLLRCATLRNPGVRETNFANLKVQAIGG